LNIVEGGQGEPKIQEYNYGLMEPKVHRQQPSQGVGVVIDLEQRIKENIDRYL
jgi:hypothetical protein